MGQVSFITAYTINHARMLILTHTKFPCLCEQCITTTMLFISGLFHRTYSQGVRMRAVKVNHSRNMINMIDYLLLYVRLVES